MENFRVMGHPSHLIQAVAAYRRVLELTTTNSRVRRDLRRRLGRYKSKVAQLGLDEGLNI